MDYVLDGAYADLRAQALALKAKDVGVTDAVYGVVMETAHPEAVVTLVALADGTASLYFSCGGGVVGAGQHEKPAIAARSLVSFAAHNLQLVATPAESTALPSPGWVRFCVLTTKGRFIAEAKDDDLGNNRHALSPLFYSAQKLITEIQQVDDGQ